jgi:hypothetical protein
MKNQCPQCHANFDFIVHAIRVGHGSQNSAITNNAKMSKSAVNASIKCH